MDAYTLHLLAAVTLRSIDRRYVLTLRPNHVLVTDANDEPVAWCATADLTSGLVVVADKLGVDYPKRPSGRQVDDAYLRIVPTPSGARSYALRVLRDLYAREPLTVLALLEGDR